MSNELSLHSFKLEQVSEFVANYKQEYTRSCTLIPNYLAKEDQQVVTLYAFLHNKLKLSIASLKEKVDLLEI